MIIDIVDNHHDYLASVDSVPVDAPLEEPRTTVTAEITSIILFKFTSSKLWFGRRRIKNMLVTCIYVVYDMGHLYIP